jgi:adenosylcobinamide kinase/adenosylcobinamide-phosphate guanylyltransferase
MKKIILVTGGQRSGKSAFAERMAKQLSDSPVYMATAHVEDEEFRERVRVHQSRRGPEWTTIEEEKYLSRHRVEGRVVLVDCCTLWLTNFFSEATPLSQIEAEFDRLTAQDATFIFVTNEIGMGGTSANEVQRRFTDMLGAFNQYVANRADEVYLLVSGISIQIKG